MKQLKLLGRGTDMLKSALKRVDSMVNAASGLGTAEDAATYARPSIDNRLTELELDYLLLQNDLARRIVEELVDDALRQGWEVADAESGDIVEEPEHLDITTAARQAGYNARAYGGGAVAMLYETGNAAKPLEPSAGAPAALVVLDKYECTAAAYDTNPKSPSFGQPLRWRVSPNNAGAAVDLGDPEFHTSRLLKFRGAPLPSRLKALNGGWDDSVLQACWTPLQNFTQAEAAIANIIQRFEVATYSISGLRDVLDDPDGASDILARMTLIQKTLSMVRAVVVDKDAGEDYQRAFSSVAGLDTLWDRLAHSVAKAAREPMTQLFGMSPSGLATDDASGRANWRKQVAAYQDTVLYPLLYWYYTLLNGGRPVIIRFNPLDEATALEEAEVGKMRAETREIYVAMGAAAPEEFRPAMQKEGLIENAESDLFDEQEEEPDPDEIPVPREPAEELPEAPDADSPGYPGPAEEEE